MSTLPADALDYAPADAPAKPLPLTIVCVPSFWGGVHVRAVCGDRDELEQWLARYYDRWHPDGYCTLDFGIQPCPDGAGWLVDVTRTESCE